jgi:23S rRNA-/tRNA-specific pseudouridylate synthase
MNDLSKARARTVEVGEESAAQRIDNFLLRELKGVPKSHVYRVLRSGQVRVNSGRVKPEYRLQPGDRVRLPPLRLPKEEEKPTARPLELPIVHEDAALLVVDKPAGVAVHGGSGVSFGVIEACAQRVRRRSSSSSRIAWTATPRACSSWRRSAAPSLSFTACCAKAKSTRNTSAW